MSKTPAPLLKTEMTPFPYSIDAAASLEAAVAMMREHGIHHLPVMHEHQLFGIVAERDVTRAMTHTRSTLTVREICGSPPYVVEMHTPLDVVAREMGDRGTAAAIIVRDDKVVGIFTATDACRVLASVLDECFPRPDDGAA